MRLCCSRQADFMAVLSKPVIITQADESPYHNTLYSKSSLVLHMLHHLVIALRSQVL